ncbi:MAG: hypothetical protein ABID45_01745, partial [Patescibacteria group bacterium]
YRSSIITVAEGISRENTRLYQSGDHLLLFDPVTLKAVAEKAQDLVGATRTIGKVVANPCDRYQAVELLGQLGQGSELAEELMEQGQVQIADDGITLRIVLPTDLDDPQTSDGEVWAEVKKAGEDVVVGLYLSVRSADSFVDFDNVICADEVMTRKEVKDMLRG